MLCLLSNEGEQTNIMSSGDGNLRVCVRVRPFSEREVDRDAECIVRMVDNQTIITPPKLDPRNNRSSFDEAKSFEFDKSYWSFDAQEPNFSSQDDVFADIGKPLLDNAFQGYNNCILAYGQTSSGKTYSMMGHGAEPGIIPRICKDMFKRIDVLEGEHVHTIVEVSYLEIYNERVRDLLNPATRGNLRVREHPSTGPYVEDLARLLVRSFQEVETLMDEGNKARTVAATDMNESSSRSHAVFILTLTQKHRDKATNIDLERVAKISLVDLAGSERSATAGTTGARLKEGADINKSLSTLGRVIAALADKPRGKRKSQAVIPYRDSVLTWMLKDSLGGNSMTTMIATISPADLNYDETLSTLRYADFAKRIKNHAVVNEDANARMIRELKDELAQLRSKLRSPTAERDSEDPSGLPLIPPEQQMIPLTQSDGTQRLVSKADILEQLSQSEKLYQDLNQTWEQKLEKTETIQKEREAALEDLGISIEKGFVGLSTPRRVPHLVNLSDDPLLAEYLVYNLKSGYITVGNEDLNTTAEIRLKGSKILKEHCVFRNVDGVVDVVPNHDAAVMVNGNHITESKRLRSGYRIILGDFHIFRFNNPLEARAERASNESPSRGSFGEEVVSPDPQVRRKRSSRTTLKGSSLGGLTELSVGRDSLGDRRDGDGNNFTIERLVSELTVEEFDDLYETMKHARRKRRGYQSENTPLESPVASFGVVPRTLEDELNDNALMHQEDEYVEAELPNTFQNLESTENENGINNSRLELESALETQQKEHERILEEHQKALAEINCSARMNLRRDALAKYVFHKWARKKYSSMAELLVENTAIMKRGQILSQGLDRKTVFQFAVVRPGQSRKSTYDTVLGETSLQSETGLTGPQSLQLGVRVVDFENQAIYLWSLSKLRNEIVDMERLIADDDSTRSMSSFTIPTFSLVGEGEVPLSGVYQSRVQDFTVNLISPYTFTSVGVVRLSLEPSTTAAALGELRFDVVIHDLVGFSESEGTKVHIELSNSYDEHTKRATQLVSGFGESKVRFGCTREMTLPAKKPYRPLNLRLSLFASVTSVHLDKLLSWDDMRDSSGVSRGGTESTKDTSTVRLSEKTSHAFAQVEIQELSESGDYKRAEVHRESDVDPGTFHLHQGLQRRISIYLTHTCGESLPWRRLRLVRAGNVRLRGPVKHASDSRQGDNIELHLNSEPTSTSEPNGVAKVHVTAQWDSAAHASNLFDRPTADAQQVQFTLSWNVDVGHEEPLHFSVVLAVHIHPRQYVRPQSMFSGLWKAEHLVHSTAALFVVKTTSTEVPRVRDIWNTDFQQEPVQGEEILDSWTPRGVSLIKDYVKGVVEHGKRAEEETSQVQTQQHTPRQTALLMHALRAWNSSKANPPPPPNYPPAPPRQSAHTTVFPLAKSPVILKSGNVYIASQAQWTLHHVELRPPFLHLYALPDRDEVGVLCLDGSRVDHRPRVDELLRREVRARKGLFVWAVYGAAGEVLGVFATGSERDKTEWLFRIDEVYMMLS